LALCLIPIDLQRLLICLFVSVLVLSFLVLLIDRFHMILELGIFLFKALDLTFQLGIQLLLHVLQIHKLLVQLLYLFFVPLSSSRALRIFIQILGRLALKRLGKLHDLVGVELLNLDQLIIFEGQPLLQLSDFLAQGSDL